VNTVRGHHQAVAVARDAGNIDLARAEWLLEAGSLVDYLDKFKSSEWRIPFRYNAAKFFLYGQQPEQAATQAELAFRDEQANPASRALASHLAAQCWLQAGSMKQKAGQLAPITLPTADQRRGRALEPKVPPGEWKRYVETADAYLAAMASDPELTRPPNERVAAISPGDVALRAAQVEYAFDNMEDAQKRLDAILTRFAEDAEVVDQSVALYLQTFQVLRDDAGFQAALVRLNALVTAAQAKVADEKGKALLAGLARRLAGFETTAEFNAATRLLEEKKPVEAAAAYEAFLARHPQDRQQVHALNNGALAYDLAAAAAKEAERAPLLAKATALREQLLAAFPDSEQAVSALLKLAEARDRAGKVDEAEKLYVDYLGKYPAGAARCGVLNNLGILLEKQKRPLDAATRYLEFAGESRCKAEDLNATGRLLFHTAEIYDKAKKAKEARSVYGQLIALDGAVTDVVVKSYVREAKKRIKGL